MNKCDNIIYMTFEQITGNDLRNDESRDDVFETVVNAEELFDLGMFSHDLLASGGMRLLRVRPHEVITGHTLTHD